MRKYAFIINNKDICKVMIYDSPEGTFVFLYNTLMETACFTDNRLVI